MASLARALAERDWVLRSGGSPGADMAFETGCDLARGKKEIYLPWCGFNNSASKLFDTPPEAKRIATRYHPGLQTRSLGIQQLRARNVCQVWGRSLDTPSDVVIAWTNHGKPSGGTGTALRITEEYRIPTINLGSAEYAGMEYSGILRHVVTLAASC